MIDNIINKELLNSESYNSAEEYVRTLEMAVQLLQREVETLRYQKISPEPSGLIENPPNIQRNLFHECINIDDVFFRLEELINTKYGIIEHDIFFFSANRSLGTVNRTEKTFLTETAVHLDEQGIIDWLTESGSVTVIPNLSTNESKLELFLILIPIKLRGINIGFYLGKTTYSSDKFSEDDKLYLKSIIESCSSIIDNIKSSEEIKRMNRKLSGLSSQMVYSSKMASIGEIAGTIAKEIETPVQIILGNLNLMKTGLGDMTRRLEIIEEQIEKINNLNSRLANLSTVKTNNSAKEIINISSLIDEVLLFLNLQFLRDGIRIEKDFDENEMKIFGNKSQIEQVFLSLLLNARDSMADGGIIMIGIYYFHGKININISDTGKGFDENKIKILFEPYNFNNDSYEKSGADLFLTKSIIHDHGGFISVISELNKGTTYKIMFPEVRND